MSEDNLRAVAAAINVTTSRGELLTLSVPAPGRHRDVIRMAACLGIEPNDIDRAEQGFLLNDGRFARRAAALVVARRANQIIRRCGGDERALYSENVW